MDQRLFRTLSKNVRSVWARKAVKARKRRRAARFEVVDFALESEERIGSSFFYSQVVEEEGDPG